MAQSGLRLYQKTRLQKTARFLRLPELLRLAKIDRLLPDIGRVSITRQPLMQHYAATTEVKGTVGLFTGCMGFLLNQETVNAAIKVLTAAGFNMSLPEQQACCSALDLHDGNGETAEQLAKINCSVFAD